MTQLAIIGGTGLASPALLEEAHREVISTPFGDPSGPVIRGRLHGQEVFFLPRHGYRHSLPPHRVNYRANLWALRDLGATEIVAVAAVGGIAPEMAPGKLALPDQIIDYTWGRANTYFEHNLEHVTHIDFTRPYCETLRQRLLAAASDANVGIVDGGTYGATQGPRLETRAEIIRMERDGCHLVGMTGMPEAALARELELCYASVAMVANWAAGKAEGEITMAVIEAHLGQALEDLGKVLACL